METMIEALPVMSRDMIEKITHLETRVMATKEPYDWLSHQIGRSDTVSSRNRLGMVFRE